MVQQRPERPPEEFTPSERLWLGAETRPAEGLVEAARAPEAMAPEPQPGDKYVVIDDIMFGRVTLAITDWPALDRQGRPHFKNSGARVIDEAPLYERIVAARAGQEAADRPLRIGDCFRIRKMKGAPDSWGLIIDVSADARDDAKTAQNAAVTLPAKLEDVTDKTNESGRRPPPGPVARPAV